MVVDPLSALGLAGNIIQFIDFGSKLISQSVEQYRSAVGTSTQYLDLEALTQSLQSVAKGLGDSTAGPDKGEVKTKDELALRQLARSCQSVAADLINILDGLKINPKAHGLNRRAQSLRQAFRSVGAEEQIKDLEHKLESYRSQLNLYSISMTRHQISTLQTELRAVQDCIRQNSLHGESRMVELLDKLDAIAQESTGKLPFQRLPAIHLELNSVSASVREQTILNSLRFPSLYIRHDNVKEAHAWTFEWIFTTGDTPLQQADEDKISPQFVEWLESWYRGDGVYWISGKAGSGKSTLMKFICNNPKTVKALQKSAKESERVFVANYFFWHAGTEMQKSQEGLMRSLLHEVLRQCPEVISTVCPRRWHASLLHEQLDWSRAELLETLQLLAMRSSISARFCFFVDGLDEYKGDHSELIEILNKLSRLPNIKLCLSSRPWEVFAKAYDSNLTRRLYINDLTRLDIIRYTRDTLEEDKEFRRAALCDPAHNALISEITDKAQGVFLWVFLVVRSLISGLTSGDTISVLRRRLEQIPAELSDVFRRMLNDVDEIYRHKTVQYLQVALVARQPYPALIYHFLEKEDRDRIFNAETALLSNDQIAEHVTQSRKQVNAATKGLLEISTSPRSADSWFAVDFLHRTVRDFLEEHSDTVIAPARTRFEYVDTYLKRSSKQDRRVDRPLLDYALRFHANHIDRKTQLQMVRILLRHGADPNVSFDGTTIWHFFLNAIGLLRGGWSLERYQLFDLTNDEMPEFVPALLSLFLQHKADVNLADCLESLLIDNGNSEIWGKRWKHLRLNILKAFIHHGANPNLLGVYSGFTVWEVFLHHLYNDQTHHITLDYQKTGLMIEAGADLDIRLYYHQSTHTNDSSDTTNEPREFIHRKPFDFSLRHHTVCDIIWARFPEQQARQLVELVDQEKKKRFLKGMRHVVGKLRSNSGRSSAKTRQPIQSDESGLPLVDL
ncbi:MAG: hypothetical protein M1822_002648 [Bathelium mastoideum]|nr:MAG: hypothetical protein M1822_002648 [Bathelium mastoideum]